MTSPPVITSALTALALAATLLLLSERWIWHRSPRQAFTRLGLGRPPSRGMAEAVLVGAAVVATFLGGAAVLGVDLELRDNWPSVLVAAMLFHGVAEELVWRGYVYGELRRTSTFGRAVLLSMPLIALTHVPIIVSSGITVGSLAVLTAIITCLPHARLYDRGGRTIWPAAVLHGSIGTWQLFERTFPVQFSVFVMCGSIVTPLAAFLFRDRRPPVAQPAAPSPTPDPTERTNA